MIECIAVPRTEPSVQAMIVSALRSLASRKNFTDARIDRELEKRGAVGQYAFPPLSQVFNEPAKLSADCFALVCTVLGTTVEDLVAELHLSENQQQSYRVWFSL